MSSWSKPPLALSSATCPDLTPALSMHTYAALICVWLCAKLIVVTADPRPSNTDLPHTTSVTSAITDIVQRKASLGLCLRVYSGSGVFSLCKIDNPGDCRLATASVLALFLCGDIQLNPGPSDKSTFPCGYCAKHVDFGQKATCCDTCDVWFHKSCASMGSSTYSNLDLDVDWFCYRCNHASNSQLYHAYEYPIHTSNSFSVLSHLPEVFASPQAHSSPVGTLPKKIAKISSDASSTPKGHTSGSYRTTSNV